MPPDPFTAMLLAYFPLVITIGIATHTPGPNNILLLQLSTLFGFKKTNPLRWGIISGFSILIFVVNLTISQLLLQYNVVLLLIKVIGSLYFTWFAYKIITMPIVKSFVDQNAFLPSTSRAPPSTEPEQNDKVSTKAPWGFWQGFGLQFVNIKAILFSLSSSSLNPNISESSLHWLIVLQTVVLVISISATHVWSLMGVFLNKLIQHTRIIKCVNIVSGLALLWFGVSLWF